MGRRLALAVALLGDPSTIILDEPVNGLDPDGVIRIRTLLRGASGSFRGVGRVRAVDLLLHPVRLRIAQTCLGDRVLTTSKPRAELPEIVPATLYRQVAAPADGGVLEVVDERRVRGR